MGKETSNLVADSLGGVESDLHDDPLVKIEVQEELGVVILDQDLDGLRLGLGSDVLEISISSKFSLIFGFCCFVDPPLLLWVLLF